MTETLDILAAYWSNPRWAIRRVTEQTSYLLGLVVLLASLVAPAVAYGVAMHFSQDELVTTITSNAAGFFVVLGLGTLIQAAFMHFWATMFGGSGKGGTLFVLLCLTNLPFILVLPAGFLLAGLPNGVTYIVLVHLILVLWTIYLGLASIQELYRISSGAAVGTYILSGILEIILLVIFFAMLVAAVAPAGVLALFAGAMAFLLVGAAAR